MARMILVLLLLGGCVPSQRPMDSDCGAAGLQHLRGDILPAGIWQTDLVRIHETGSPLTMDFRPERLNIELSPSDGTVVSVYCG